jgi:predicted Fe-Mo cluster-binding NifX family protein
MKIAIPVKQNGEVDDHFGHCEFYEVFTVTDNHEILAVETIPSVQGCGCKSNIASELAAKGVSVMLAGGIGGGAINKLNSCGIEVIRGCQGLAENIVQEFLAGQIADSGETCQHHEHHSEAGHVCNH